MSRDALGAFIREHPRGVRWAWSFAMTGLPYNWTCGKAPWPDDTYVLEKPGAFANPESLSYSMTSDPLKPLKTGSGVTVKLLDDHTGYLRVVQAPLSGAGSRLVAEFAIGDTTMFVEDNTFANVDDFLYLGSTETVTVVVVDGGGSAIDVTRAQFNTYEQRHNRNAAPIGPKVTTSPRTFAGRYGEIRCSPINEITGAITDVYVFWAGYVSEFRFTDPEYEVLMDELTKAVDTFWPAVLATGRAHQPASVNAMIYLAEEEFKVYLSMNDTAFPDIVHVQSYLLETDVSGVTAPVTPAAGEYSIALVAQWLQVTLVTLSGIGMNYLYIGYGLDVGPFIALKYMNRSTYDFNLDMTRGLGAALAYNGFSGDILHNDYNGNLGSIYSLHQNELKPTDNQVTVYLDDVKMSFDPTLFFTNTGYVKIQQGDAFEIAEFTEASVSSSNSRKVTLTFGGRGVAGTKITHFGKPLESGEPSTEDLVVSQIAMFPGLHAARHTAIAQVMMCLLGTGVSYQYNGYWDLASRDLTVGIPQRYVAWEEAGALSTADMPYTNYFWIKKGGEGEKALEAFLQMAGITLVTRRFTRGAENLFGISIDQITPPNATAFSGSVSDSNRKAGSSVLIDYNERLLINVVEMTPYLSAGKDDPDGVPIIEYAEDSISDYGRAEALKLDPSVVIGNNGSTAHSTSFFGGAIPTTQRELQVAEVANIAARWLAAFSQGNYALTLTGPHLNWCWQVGDRAAITLTGVPNSAGGQGLAEVRGKVIEAKYNVSTATGVIKFRLSYSTIYELAPSALITASDVGGVLLTLADNEFSAPDQPNPFGDQGTDTKDIMWFDRSVHGTDISVYISEIDGTSVGVVRTVTATNLVTGVMTVNSDIGAPLRSAITAGSKVVVTFDVITATTSALAKQFAYVVSNAVPPAYDKRWL